MHPVEELLARLDACDAYPPDVTPVPELLPGTAAFAASAGLWREPKSDELPPFPHEGLMIIGHNLDSREAYEVRRQSGISHGDQVPGSPLMSTWRGLYAMLDGAGVGRTEFFFTNVFVGLKEGGPLGDVTAHPAPAYRAWCRDFLAHQVQTMRPRVVLVLGRPAWTAFAADTDPCPWPPGRLPPAGSASTCLFGHRTVIVPAKHPSIAPRREDADALRLAWAS